MKPPTFLARLATSALRISFDLLYHSFAWSYDWVAWIVSLGRWNEWVLSTLPDLAGPSILELGHGPGHLQIALAESDRYVTGIDESRQMSYLARKKFRHSNHTPRLVRAQAQNLPFMNEAFQQVVSTFPSDYIFDPVTLAEIQRILLTGGDLIVLPSANLTGKGWGERLVAGLVHITGQAPEWTDGYLEPFRKAGFIAQIERRNLPSSQLTIIKAKKIH